MNNINRTKNIDIKHEFSNIAMLKIFISEHQNNQYFGTVVYLEKKVRPDFSKGINGEYELKNLLFFSNSEKEVLKLCEDWIKNNLGADYELML